MHSIVNHQGEPSLILYSQIERCGSNQSNSYIVILKKWVQKTCHQNKLIRIVFLNIKSCENKPYFKKEPKMKKHRFFSLRHLSLIGNKMLLLIL
ncbi:MAG: hypothetical protein ACJAS3_002965 [Roseivirga sp.]|jgi:hypothetical protein